MLIVFAGLVAASAIANVENPARAVAEQPLVELFSYEDYPRDALLQEVEGVVRVRLSVSAEGRVRECDIVESAGHPALDRTTCDILLERSRFTPARDNEGRATSDEITTRVRWQIDESVQFGQMSMVLRFRVERGSEHCSVSWTGRGTMWGGDEIPMPASYCVSWFGGFSVLAGQPGVIELRHEEWMLPRGDVLPSPNRANAEVLWQYGGEFTVAPNGTVSRCAATLDETGPSIFRGLAETLKPCARFEGWHFEENDGGRELRYARFEGAYIIVREPRPSPTPIP